MLDFIDRFGTEAVMGRTLGYFEVRSLFYVDGLRKAYTAKMKAPAGAIAAWDKNNPGAAAALAFAREAAVELGYYEEAA